MNKAGRLTGLFRNNENEHLQADHLGMFCFVVRDVLYEFANKLTIVLFASNTLDGFQISIGNSSVIKACQVLPCGWLLGPPSSRGNRVWGWGLRSLFSLRAILHVLHAGLRGHGLPPGGPWPLVAIKSHCWLFFTAPIEILRWLFSHCDCSPEPPTRCMGSRLALEIRALSELVRPCLEDDCLGPRLHGGIGCGWDALLTPCRDVKFEAECEERVVTQLVTTLPPVLRPD